MRADDDVQGLLLLAAHLARIAEELRAAGKPQDAEAASAGFLAITMDLLRYVKSRWQSEPEKGLQQVIDLR